MQTCTRNQIQVCAARLCLRQWEGDLEVSMLRLGCMSPPSWLCIRIALQVSKKGQCTRREVVFYSRHVKMVNKAYQYVFAFCTGAMCASRPDTGSWPLLPFSSPLTGRQETEKRGGRLAFADIKGYVYPQCHFYPIPSRLTWIFSRSLSVNIYFHSLSLSLSVCHSISLSLLLLFLFDVEATKLLFGKGQQNLSSALLKSVLELGRNWQTGFSLFGRAAESWKTCRAGLRQADAVLSVMIMGMSQADTKNVAKAIFYVIMNELWPTLVYRLAQVTVYDYYFHILFDVTWCYYKHYIYSIYMYLMFWYLNWQYTILSL